MQQLVGDDQFGAAGAYRSHVQRVGGGLEHQRLADQQLLGRQRLLQQCMAEEFGLDRAVEPSLAAAPEQAVPVVGVPQQQQRGVAQQDDDAALVEVGECVLRA